MAKLWPIIQSLVNNLATRRKHFYLWTLFVGVDVGQLLSSITSFEQEFYGEFKKFFVERNYHKFDCLQRGTYQSDKKCCQVFSNMDITRCNVQDQIINTSIYCVFLMIVYHVGGVNSCINLI